MFNVIVIVIVIIIVIIIIIIVIIIMVSSFVTSLHLMVCGPCGPIHCRGNRLSNTACLTQAFFKRGE